MAGMKRGAVHKLLYPIVIEKKPAGSEEVVEEELKPAGFAVVLRRAKAKDLRAFDRHEDAEFAAIIEIIASCSNLDMLEAENLDAADFGELGNALGLKSDDGPKTGEPA